MTMSDSTGFGAGGTTAVLTVGPSVNGDDCDIAGPAANFSFDLDGELEQCRSVFNGLTR
jgi:hypothetical protein